MACLLQSMLLPIGDNMHRMTKTKEVRIIRTPSVLRRLWTWFKSGMIVDVALGLDLLLFSSVPPKIGMGRLRSFLLHYLLKDLLLTFFVHVGFLMLDRVLGCDLFLDVEEFILFSLSFSFLPGGFAWGFCFFFFAFFYNSFWLIHWLLLLSKLQFFIK